MTEWKFLCLCLISDYSLITYLHSFVYELAESTRTYIIPSLYKSCVNVYFAIKSICYVCIT